MNVYSLAEEPASRVAKKSFTLPSSKAGTSYEMLTSPSDNHKYTSLPKLTEQETEDGEGVYHIIGNLVYPFVDSFIKLQLHIQKA